MCRTSSAIVISSIAFCLMALAAAAPVVAETVVTTCGQETTGQATLNADLDCTGYRGAALTMHGGTLTMNGHTITGGNSFGIECDISCRIIGPGTITGSTNTIVGVRATLVSLRLSQVDISGCAHAAVQVWDSATIDGPAVISGNTIGIQVGKRARLKDLTLTSNIHASRGSRRKRRKHFDAALHDHRQLPRPRRA